MHKILVFSDSHGLSRNLLAVLEKEKDVDTVIHLGDIEGEENVVERALMEHRPLPAFLTVRGNCDTFSNAPLSRVVEWDGVKVFLTHGHRYEVNEFPTLLAFQAEENGCSVALFGHIHKPVDTEVNGVHVFNPGSITLPRQEDHRPTYGILTIADDGTVTTEHRFLNGKR